MSKETLPYIVAACGLIAVTVIGQQTNTNRYTKYQLTETQMRDLGWWPETNVARNAPATSIAESGTGEPFYITNVYASNLLWQDGIGDAMEKPLLTIGKRYDSTNDTIEFYDTLGSKKEFMVITWPHDKTRTNTWDYVTPPTNLNAVTIKANQEPEVVKTSNGWTITFKPK